MVIELLIIVGVWLMDRFLPWSLMASLALWWGRSKVIFQPRRMGWLILLGLVEDISRVQQMGFRSMVLISLMLVTWLIARHYQSRQLWWWYLLGIGAEVVMRLVDGVSLSMVGIIAQSMGLLWLNWWQDRFGKENEIYVQS